MKSADVIIIGAGVIGLSTAWRLQQAGSHVLILERHEPAGEASHAAAGMLAVCDPHNDPALQPLAEASANLYPSFVHALQEETGLHVDIREDGVIGFLDPTTYSQLHPRVKPLTAADIDQLDPAITPAPNAYFFPERFLDPRALCAALLKAFRDGNGDLATGSPVTHISHDAGTFSVTTTHTTYYAPMVINCAGAWAGQFGEAIPTRPVKGQMLSVVPITDPAPHPAVLRHVVRAPEVYLVPRSDGRIIIGSTLEEAGFDKNVDPAVIQRLHQAAGEIVHGVRYMRIHEAWAGLRPGTPDGRPILGPATTTGSFIAAGHYRDGILLAPITAEILLSLIKNEAAAFDLRPFAPNRFQR